MNSKQQAVTKGTSGVKLLSRILIGLLAFLGSWSVVYADSSSVVYLPFIAAHNECALSEPERLIVNHMQNHPDQKRTRLICNPKLIQVARLRAEDMAKHGYFDHTDPAGRGPNYLVSLTGYKLPKYYNKEVSANNIESIAAGQALPEAVWNGWMHSTTHSTHILGKTSFYAKQTEYGIAYVHLAGSPYIHYWVIITVEPGE